MKSRFIDNGDGTILDTQTGLMWSSNFTENLTWKQAIDFASKLELGGLSDWRVPTVKEFMTLIEYAALDPASSFPGMPSESFWTSQLYKGDESVAWFVDFYGGYVNNIFKTRLFAVRCVR
jgi:hypothetical protein